MAGTLDWRTLFKKILKKSHLLGFFRQFCTEEGIKLPLKGVLSEKNGGPYECLRQCGLVSLFKYLSPGGTIPQYASKNFQTILTYRGVNGKDIPLRDSEDIVDVLEKACGEHLMDDNDDTIIEKFIKNVKTEFILLDLRLC